MQYNEHVNVYIYTYFMALSNILYIPFVSICMYLLYPMYTYIYTWYQISFKYHRNSLSLAIFHDTTACPPKPCGGKCPNFSSKYERFAGSRRPVRSRSIYLTTQNLQAIWVKLIISHLKKSATKTKATTKKTKKNLKSVNTFFFHSPKNPKVYILFGDKFKFHHFFKHFIKSHRFCPKRSETNGAESSHQSRELVIHKDWQKNNTIRMVEGLEYKKSYPLGKRSHSWLKYPACEKKEIHL